MRQACLTLLFFIIISMHLFIPYPALAKDQPFLFHEEQILECSAPAGGSPLSMITADFDEDGVPDLIIGYSTGSGNGILFFHKGNIDFIYPNSPEAKLRRAEGKAIKSPFYPPAWPITIAVEPRYLVAGDFDADGHWDIVASAPGIRSLTWLRGKGTGEFLDPELIHLEHSIIYLAAGEINRIDGLTDLAVSVSGDRTSQLLVFEGPQGALRHHPEIISLSEPASAFVLGEFDNEFGADLAAACGSKILIIHGRDRKLSLSPEYRKDVRLPVIETFSIAEPIQSLASGNFIGEEPDEIAVLDERGGVYVLSPATGSLKEAGRTSPGLRFAALDYSGQRQDALIMLDRENGRIDLVKDIADSFNYEALNFLRAGSASVAVLPMRLNPDALNDLVILRAGDKPLSVIISKPNAVFVVNQVADGADAVPGNGVCETAPGNGYCTLRAAIQEANAYAGVDSIHFGIGSGVKNLAPTSVLPNITQPVTIDATTQPGYSGTPIIQIDGVNITSMDQHGLRISTSACVIRGLSIIRFSSLRTRAILIDTLGNNSFIENNYIGLDASGSSTTTGNSWSIRDEGDVDTIGGTVAAARNVSSLGYYGIIVETTASSTLIRGNYIGTDASGNLDRGNTYNGIYDVGASTTIGGTTAGARNLISGNNQEGILGGTNLIQGNWIGIAASGSFILPNNWSGIYLFDGSNTIGGTSSSARNIISGNGSYGIRLEGTSIVNNYVQGNWIGVNTSGGGMGFGNQTGLGLLGSTSNNTIGGIAAGATNVISRNNGNGISISGANNNIIQGNLIGTDSSGTSGAPNAGAGIYFTSASAGNQIGGINSGESNTIAFNNTDGIFVSDGTGNAIRGNRIYSNTGLGIDLGTDGVTPNDMGDADTGANNLQNFPVLTTAYSNGINTTIQGTLNSIATTTFTIHFYSTTACDSSGNGEGEEYLGSTPVTTNGSGDVSFTTSVSPVTPGKYISATATDSSNNTSEFSACITVLSVPDINASPDPADFGTIAVGHTGTRTITVQNLGQVDLVITTVSSPSAPFTIIADGCSGQTIVQNASCAITVRFSPTAAGAAEGSFIISSNDPDEASYTVDLQGTGAVFSSTTWARNYGGTANDAATHYGSLLTTPDGGSILFGYTQSYGAGACDLLLLKLDSGGNTQWRRTYGGTADDYAASIKSAPDGGFIITGTTVSYGSGGEDIWVIKTDKDGNVQWQKAYGGAGMDNGLAGAPTYDGGYIIAGRSSSFTVGGWDGLILKLDSAGNIIWRLSYGGIDNDLFHSIEPTRDGGYIVSGYSWSFGGGNRYLWVLKLNGSGAIVWQKILQGNGTGYHKTMVSETSEGGFAVLGWTDSSGAGLNDIWLTRLDNSGTLLWQKTYGGTGNDLAFMLHQTSDSGFAIIGSTQSFGAGGWDAWFLKVDFSGLVQWQKTYGGSSDEQTYALQETADGGYLLAGDTASFSGGGTDLWLLKVDSSGNMDSTCTITTTTNITYKSASLATSVPSPSVNSYSVSTVNSSATIQTPTVPSTLICAWATDIEVTPLNLDFGTVRVGNPAVRTVAVRNRGGANLSITTVTSPAVPFSKIADSCTGQTLPGGGACSITIQFSPTSINNYTGSFQITSTDVDESSVTVNLDGDGVESTGNYWIRAFGGTANEEPRNIRIASDGGFLFSSVTTSFTYGGNDAWIVKLNRNGIIEWQKHHGNTYSDEVNWLETTTDGGSIASGRYSTGTAEASEDFYVIKTSASGTLQWKKTYGGSNSDVSFTIAAMPDGTYAVGGASYSFGAGGRDGLVFKLDSSGNIQWQKAYGGTGFDYLFRIRPTSDGGYIVTGRASLGTSNFDVWLFKLDSSGNLQWHKMIGGPSDDSGFFAEQTTDGGYILAGDTASFGNGPSNVWVIKLDGSGNIQWEKAYGGNNSDHARSVRLTVDGGYLVAGFSNSFSNGNWDGWLLKLDFAGEILWQKIYGGTLSDQLTDVVVQSGTTETYIGVGWTESYGAGLRDAWVLVLDHNGNADSSCSFIGSSNVVSIDTTASVVSSTLTVTATGESATTPADMQTDSSASVNSQCSSPCDIAVSPGSIDFGVVQVGSSSSQNVTVQNTGGANLIFGSLTAPSPPFSITNDTCSGQTLPPGNTCSISVQFAPTTYGNFTGNFVINSNDPNESAFTVPLQGTGSAPDVNAIPNPADFGTLFPGELASQSITVQNIGNSNLTMGSVTNPSVPFSITNENCAGQTVNPGGNCTITVQFAPASVGDFNASTNISSNDPDENPYSINLHGIASCTGNNAPVPDADGPYLVTDTDNNGSEPVSLDGTGSSDSTGIITLYEWDLNNDGTYDVTGPTPTVDMPVGATAIVLRVTDSCNASATTTTTVTVRCAQASISLQPVSQTACTGDSIIFTVDASGPGTLSYQWRKNGIILFDDGHYSGTQTATLTINPVDGTDATDFDVVISQSCTPVQTISSSAELTVETVPGPVGNTLLVTKSTYIDLDWSDASGATSYTILRCDASAGFCLPSSYQTSVSSNYTDMNAPGSYWYKIEAVNICGVSQ